MKIRNLLFLPLLILLCLFSSAFAQTAQIVYDPAKESNYEASDDETAFVKTAVAAKIKKIWTADVCPESLTVEGRIDGAFTRANAAQTAYLFEYCVTGNGLANDGILITEKNKPVGIYIFDGGEPIGFSKLADINQNKLDEMVVEWMGGMHGGEVGSAAAVLEVKAGNLKEFGTFQTMWSVCDGDVLEAKCGYAYKITATAAPVPVFYQLKMNGNGKKLRADGKPFKAKIIKADVKYRTVK